MTRIDILNYYRKFIEKSRSFCAGLYSNGRKLVKNLNVKTIDVFLIIAVIMAMVYIVVNHPVGTVIAPEHTTNVNISPRCAELFGKETVDALIMEFEKLNPDLRIREADPDAPDSDIVFFDDGESGSLMNVALLVSFMDLFAYNINILEEANLDRPPKSRAEFLAAAKAVAEKDADGTVFPFALGLSPEDPLALRRDFYPWVWASGVDINALDLSGDNPPLPRALNETIALFGQLNREKLLAPDTFERTRAQRLTEFAENKIAMMTISARDLVYLRDSEYGITFGITTLPALTQGKNRLGLSGIYAGIDSDSAVPDEARKFLSFLAKNSDVLAEAIGAVPGSFPAVFAGDHIARDPLFAKAWEIFGASDIVDYKPGQPSEEKFNRLISEKLIDALKIKEET